MKEKSKDRSEQRTEEEEENVLHGDLLPFNVSFIIKRNTEIAKNVKRTTCNN